MGLWSIILASAWSRSFTLAAFSQQYNLLPANLRVHFSCSTHISLNLSATPLRQWWLDVGPASYVTGQHWTSNGRTLVLQRWGIRVIVQQSLDTGIVGNYWCPPSPYHPYLRASPHPCSICMYTPWRCAAVIQSCCLPPASRTYLD